MLIDLLHCLCLPHKAFQRDEASYRAPEQTDSDFGPRGSYTDVWGFATTILHLATGQLPYSGLSQFQIMTAMIKKRPPFVSESLPEGLQSLLKQCLNFDIAQRPSVAQLSQVSFTCVAAWSLNPCLLCIKLSK